MSESHFDRRTLLKGALVSLVALPAASRIHDAGAANAPPRLDEKDPVATALGYVSDARKVVVTKFPQFKAGSKCSNCLQLVGKQGDEWRPCNIFPGKLVNANGWCSVWVAKPGAKV